MDPLPDYGLDSYKGTGKLQDKVAVITGKINHPCLQLDLYDFAQVVIPVLVELLL
jgi:hypothetical protein